MNDVQGEVGDIDKSPFFTMLRKINNHGIHAIDDALKFRVANLTLTKTDWSALCRIWWTLAIADGTMADLTIFALWIAEIAALLLAIGALPFSTMSHIRVF